MKNQYFRNGPLATLITAAFFMHSGALAQSDGNSTGKDEARMDRIEVIGRTPADNVGMERDRLPFNVQSATSEEIDRSKSLSVGDFLNRHFGSVSINEAQNNPLQPDVQYRGFTSSPLLGLPQGLAVYQNGVRVNEAFGDTVNWDLILESSIASIDLISGANPVYGLNTLGGALSVTTKNGFTHPGHSFESYGGTYERSVSTIESGGNNGRWGYFVTANYFDESGWRDASETDALNLFATLGWRAADTTLDLSLNHGDTDLIGNGAIPVELEAIDRSAVFTSPDVTENDLFMLNLEGTHRLTDALQISGNAYYRSNETDSFNGDGSEFEECEEAAEEALEDAGYSMNLIENTITELEDNRDIGEQLCEEIEDDIDGSLTTAMALADELEEELEIIEDQAGDEIDAEFNGEELDAINNVSLRDQESFGANLQTVFDASLFGNENSLIVGASYHQALTEFNAVVEVVSLKDDRSTTRTGIFVPEEGTQIKTHTRTWSIYFTDTIALMNNLDLTLSGRYNDTSVQTSDRSDGNPLVEPEDPEALNGDHSFTRFNPAVGLSWAARPGVTVYGSYSESSRAPTPVELACSHEDAPCSLPNAFLADPPLEQVVTKSFEGGVRGSTVWGIRWNAGLFHSINEDDIIFGSTGGTASNEGFFDNVGDTKRIGFELGLSGGNQVLDWFFNYSLLDATFDDAFSIVSANHGMADDNDQIQVDKGDRIPGLSEHTLKAGASYRATPKFTVGADLNFNSDQYYRGDEANLLDTIDSYIIVNARASYQFHKNVMLFGVVNNLFDTDYETFGLFGEPDEIDSEHNGRAFETFENNGFVGVGAPISAYLGLKVTF